jgi:hypothetical protein
MKLEIKSIQGEVQELTEKSIKVNNYWFNVFEKELLKGINQGEQIEIKYTDNTKNNKVYHNLKEIKIIKLEQELMTIWNLLVFLTLMGWEDLCNLQ